MPKGWISNASIQNLSIATLTTTGNVSVGGNLSVTGTTTETLSETLYGDMILGDADDKGGKIQAYKDASGNLGVDYDPDTSFWIDVTLDVNGNKIDLDADADTSITADTDDQIDIEISGADDFQFTANIFSALSGSQIKTDTINETTGAAGVTIDSVLLKDGQMDLEDDKKILLGTGDDGELYVNSDDLYIRNVTSDKDIIISVNDGGAQTTLVTFDADVPQVNFGNVAVVNVGAAGNDFGASNTLVTTTFSGVVTMGADLDMNDYNLYNVDKLQGATDDWIIIQGRNEAADNSILFTTPGVGAGFVETTRLAITGRAATAVATWSAVTHTGLVLSGALTTDGQYIVSGNTAKRLMLSGGTTTLNDGAYIGLYGNTETDDEGRLELQAGLVNDADAVIEFYTPDTTPAYQSRLKIGQGVTAVATWSAVTHTGLVLSGALNVNSQDLNTVLSIIGKWDGNDYISFVADDQFDVIINSGAVASFQDDQVIVSQTLLMSGANIDVATNDIVNMDEIKSRYDSNDALKFVADDQFDVVIDSGAVVSVQDDNVVFSQDLEFADNKGIKTGTANDDTVIFQAIINAGAVVEVGRLRGGAVPYFSMGDGQEFKFYHTGVADLSGGTVTFGDTVEVGETVRHTGDIDTRLLFETDSIKIDAAGSTMIQANGTGVGFYAVTPVARSAGWTITNDQTDRTFDADTVAVAELADVVATLITDLAATGIIGASA